MGMKWGWSVQLWHPKICSSFDFRLKNEVKPDICPIPFGFFRVECSLIGFNGTCMSEHGVYTPKFASSIGKMMTNHPLDWLKGKIYRKPWFLPLNMSVSGKFSCKPIQWTICWKQQNVEDIWAHGDYKKTTQLRGIHQYFCTKKHSAVTLQ